MANNHDTRAQTRKLLWISGCWFWSVEKNVLRHLLTTSLMGNALKSNDLQTKLFVTVLLYVLFTYKLQQRHHINTEIRHDLHPQE